MTDLGHSLVAVQEVGYMLRWQGEAAVVERWFAASVVSLFCTDHSVSTDHAQCYQQQHSHTHATIGERRPCLQFTPESKRERERETVILVRE